MSRRETQSALALPALIGEYTKVLARLSPSNCQEPGCDARAVNDGRHVLCEEGHCVGGGDRYSITPRSRELGAFLVLQLYLQWSHEDVRGL
jgi:hypothetical protein